MDNAFAPLALGWRTAPGVAIAPAGGTGGLVLKVGEREPILLSPPHDGLARALLALQEGANEERLAELAGEPARLYYYLARLTRLGLLEASADLEGTAVLRLLPRRPTFALPHPCGLPKSVILDRFAYLRRTPRGAVLHSPEAPCDLVLEDPACGALVARLAAGPIAAGREQAAAEHAVLMLLVGLGFAVDAAAIEPPARQTWEFHDRLFHRAARSYDDGIARGGTYRFRDRFPSPPAIRARHPGETIALPSPDRLGGTRSLGDVMEARRSRREMSAAPLGLEEIGAVLHRVARVVAHDAAQDLLLRPYPSAGAIHELEFYLAVDAGTALEPGFYHYRGQDHALTRLANPGAASAAAAMLAECAQAWGRPGEPPQVLVVIASRLPRLAWKYEGIAYKMSLMNAGVALQSLYLVITDLGLAGCAAGSGNPELFARATGTDPWEETSIAEFGFGLPAATT
jgi:SagB-type dehydrogenase family enzyme